MSEKEILTRFLQIENSSTKEKSIKEEVKKFLYNYNSFLIQYLDN